jgi:hypothetical protein
MEENMSQRKLKSDVSDLGKLILFVDSCGSKEFIKNCVQNRKVSYSNLKPYKERFKKREFRKVKESSLIYLLLNKCLETKQNEKIDFRFLKSFLQDIKKAFLNVYKKAFAYYKKKSIITKTTSPKNVVMKTENEFSFKRQKQEDWKIPMNYQTSNSPKNCNRIIKNIFYENEENIPNKNHFYNVKDKEQTNSKNQIYSKNTSKYSISKFGSINSDMIDNSSSVSNLSDLCSNNTSSKCNYSSNSISSMNMRNPKFIRRRTSYKKLPKKSNSSISSDIKSYVNRNCLKGNKSSNKQIKSKIVSRLMTRLNCIKKSSSISSSNFSMSSYSSVFKPKKLSKSPKNSVQRNISIKSTKRRKKKIPKTLKSQPGSRRNISKKRTLR